MVEDKERSFIIISRGEETGHISYTCYHLLEGLAEFDIWLKGKDYFGHGFGNKSIKLLAKQMFDKDFKKIIIRPSKQNITAIKSYKKAGFREQNPIFTIYYKPEFTEEYGFGDYGKGNGLFLVLKKRHFKL